MHDISVGGALLETEALIVGENIRVEIEGDGAGFTMDAVVVRICSGRGAKGFGVRFVDREHEHYSDWLHDEWIRLSMWQCRDADPLIATRDGVIPGFPNDPIYIPVHPVLELIKSRPGTSVLDLIRLESFDRMYIRIAVARLIESRALTVMKAPTAESKTPRPARTMRRIWESLWSARSRGGYASAEPSDSD